jgi:peptide/nickel transport system ATP-binding protein
MIENQEILRISGLCKFFESGKGIFSQNKRIIKAVDDISFSIKTGETLGLVGESGCGKTTVGRCILRGVEPSRGNMFFRHPRGISDLAHISPKEMRSLRRYFQMIFQDPFSSLNARWTVFDIISEPLVSIMKMKTNERKELVADIMIKVGLRPEYMKRYPHSFSGGERQRIGIARALITNPLFVIADEPVSALDVSVRAQTLNLMYELQSTLHLTYLFISHDLSVIEYLCDRVIVMYVGNIVEIATPEDMYKHPLHPYTEALLSAIPCRHPDKKRERVVLSGDIADPANLPSGCPFHPRCKYVQDVCRESKPELQDDGSGRFIRCHCYKDLVLRGEYF